MTFLYEGLNHKLDVGLYQLDQRVACQRHRQKTLDATSKIRSAVAYVRNAFMPQPAPVLV